MIINSNNGKCIEMSDFTVSNSDGGIISNVQAEGLILQRLILAENRIGISANPASESDDLRIYHKNITYFALARPKCEACYIQNTSCPSSIAIQVPVVQFQGNK